MERGTLVRVEMVTREFATSHTANHVDEITAVEIFKPVLIQVMGVGTMIEIVRRRVFPTLFITSVLCNIQYMSDNEQGRTYTITLLVEHEGSNGPPCVGTSTGLTTDTNSGTAPAVLVLGTGDSTRRGRHWIVVM